jgi:hypothetical protein
LWLFLRRSTATEAKHTGEGDPTNSTVVGNTIVAQCNLCITCIVTNLWFVSETSARSIAGEETITNLSADKELFSGIDTGTNQDGYCTLT